MDLAEVVEGIDRALREAGTAERAEQEQRYLKSTIRHYGASVPAVRRTVKTILRDTASRDGPLDHDAVVETAARLWDEPTGDPVFDRRMAAAVLLEEAVDRLGPGDIDLLERLLRESGTWALVDNLAASVVGALVDTHRGLGSRLDRWAVDDDFWIRRSALLALLVPLRSGAGDFERFSRYADAMLGETEFFIRKAIGWVLRDTARKRPDLVFDWIGPRTGRASGVTVREVVKRLPPDRAERVRVAHREGRAVDGFDPVPPAGRSS